LGIRDPGPDRHERLPALAQPAGQRDRFLVAPVRDQHFVGPPQAVVAYCMAGLPELRELRIDRVEMLPDVAHRLPDCVEHCPGVGRAHCRAAAAAARLD